MIEPAAGRLFDIYYQYTAQSDLVALQSLTEEAYKPHERLSKSSPKSQGLFEKVNLSKNRLHHSQGQQLVLIPSIFQSLVKASQSMFPKLLNITTR